MPATSAPTETRPPVPDHPTPARPSEAATNMLGLSTAQVAGSALAAVSAAVCASWLGVAGTVVGAALGSVVGTVGSALYTHSLRHGGTVVRRTVGLDRNGSEVTVTEVRRTPLREQLGDLRWRRLGAAAAVVLVVAFGGLTLIEGLTGRPVSGLAGDDSGGTTLGRVLDPGSPTGQDAPTEEPTDVPTDRPTDQPTDLPTDAPTGTPTDDPTDAPTQSPSDAPTGTPTDDPTDDPTDAPTGAPTDVPTGQPTGQPTGSAAPSAVGP